MAVKNKQPLFLKKNICAIVALGEGTWKWNKTAPRVLHGILYCTLLVLVSVGMTSRMWARVYLFKMLTLLSYRRGNVTWQSWHSKTLANLRVNWLILQWLVVDMLLFLLNSWTSVFFWKNIKSLCMYLVIIQKYIYILKNILFYVVCSTKLKLNHQIKCNYLWCFI